MPERKRFFSIDAFPNCICIPMVPCTVFRLSLSLSNIQYQTCLALHHGLALRLGRQKRTSGNETNRVPRRDQLKITCKLGGPCQGLYLCEINVQLQACQAHKTYVHLVTTAWISSVWTLSGYTWAYGYISPGMNIIRGGTFSEYAAFVWVWTSSEYGGITEGGRCVIKKQLKTVFKTSTATWCF